MHPLVAEAMKKAAIIWYARADQADAAADATVQRDQPSFPVWCLPVGDSLYVVTGGDEQPAPGLAEVAEVTVRARGDHGGRIASWRAQVTVIEPESDDWREIAPQLAAKRLNASGPSDELVAHWTTESAIVRLTPIGDEVEAGESAPTSSGAATPRPTPAAPRVAKPYRLHRVKRR